MLDHMTANNAVEFAVRKRIGDHAKIVKDVSMGPRIGIYADGAGVLILTAANIEDLLLNCRGHKGQINEAGLSPD